MWKKRWHAERGQALPALVLGIGLVFTLGMLVGGVVLERFDARTRVQNAADAAALAGVQGGELTSRRVAQENDATLAKYVEKPGRVEVEVVRKGERRTASAMRIDH